MNAAGILATPPALQVEQVFDVGDVVAGEEAIAYADDPHNYVAFGPVNITGLPVEKLSHVV